MRGGRDGDLLPPARLPNSTRPPCCYLWVATGCLYQGPPFVDGLLGSTR